MGIILPARVSGYGVRRRRGVAAGLGISLSEEAAAGAGATVGDLVLAARDGLESSRAFAERAAAAQSPQDLAAVAAASEAERDAARGKALAVVRTLEGAAAAGVGVLVFLSVMTAGVGLVVGAAAAAIVLAVEAGAWVIDKFEDDPDNEDERARATEHAEWFARYGLPLPKFHKPRHGDVRSYANELQELRETIERLSSDPVREAIWRAGEALKRGIDRSPIVIAAYVVAGEHGRNWGYVHHLSDEDDRSASLDLLVSNREAIELLHASIGVLAAEAAGLPPTHYQTCIDSAAIGWETGVDEVPDNKLAGVVAFGYAQLFAEATAADWRARLDAAETAAPGILERIFPGTARRADLLGSTADRFGSLLSPRARAAVVEEAEARGVSDEIVDLLKPPAPAKPEPEAGAVSAPVVVGVGAAVAGVGWFVFKSAAGAAIRRALGL